MAKPGHKLSSIWQGFTKIESEKYHKDAVCKHCQETIPCAQPGRVLYAHVMACPAAPDDKKYAYLFDYLDKTPQPNPVKKRGARDESESEAAQSFTCACSCGAHKGNRVQPETMKELQLALARFYSAGIAFRIVENKRFRIFVRLMCPGFSFPGRNRLAKELLEEIFIEEKFRVIEELKMRPYLGISSDGWTNPNHESVVNNILTTPGMRPVFGHRR